MKTEKKYSGVIVPMVSPFDEKLRIDREAVGNLADHLAAAEVIPFILGTTGEAASMSREMKTELAAEMIRAVDGRRPVFAGISSNSLEESVELACRYKDLGIEAAVATLPFYYPLKHSLMRRYLEYLAERVPLPLILYNMPATTGLSIPLELIHELSHHPKVAGLKDSERDVERIDRSLELWSGRKDFSYLLGWAGMSAYALVKGADGIVPSTANLVPGLFRELYLSARDGRAEQVEKLQARTDEIALLYQKDRQLDRSIPALKALMSLRGLCGPHVLPPLYQMEGDEEKKYLKETAKELDRLSA